MRSVPRRKKGGYFESPAGAPASVNVSVDRRVSFSEVDPLGILWHGHYPRYFEQVNEELGRRCGMSYVDFKRAGLRAPIVQLHVDYFASPQLAEEVRIVGRMIWNEGARLNIEYEVYKENEILAAAGYTVQMFISAEGDPLMASPPLLERCRERWRNGEFSDMQ